jgi:hypothetical protein
MVLAEQDDEWQDGRRYFRPETMALIDAVIEISHRRAPTVGGVGRAERPEPRWAASEPTHVKVQVS